MSRAVRLRQAARRVLLVGVAVVGAGLVALVAVEFLKALAVRG